MRYYRNGFRGFNCASDPGFALQASVFANKATPDKTLDQSTLKASPDKQAGQACSLNRRNTEWYFEDLNHMSNADIVPYESR